MEKRSLGDVSEFALGAVLEFAFWPFRFAEITYGFL